MGNGPCRRRPEVLIAEPPQSGVVTDTLKVALSAQPFENHCAPRITSFCLKRAKDVEDAHAVARLHRARALTAAAAGCGGRRPGFLAIQLQRCRPNRVTVLGLHGLQASAGRCAASASHS